MNKPMILGRHFPQLDVLRGVAVLMVMVIHSNGNVPSLHIRRFMRYGFVGVDLFFVLSGFLITGILLRTKNENGYFVNCSARSAAAQAERCRTMSSMAVVLVSCTKHCRSEKWNLRTSGDHLVIVRGR